jgi:hypothetical protein
VVDDLFLQVRRGHPDDPRHIVVVGVGHDREDRLIDAGRVEQPLEAVGLTKDPRGFGPALGLDGEDARRPDHTVRNAGEPDVEVVQDAETVLAELIQRAIEPRLRRIPHIDASDDARSPRGPSGLVRGDDRDGQLGEQLAHRTPLDRRIAPAVELRDQA